MNTGGGSRFQWRSASRSHVGTVRKVNEDAVLERPDIGLWVVADGMGGHAAGDVAATMVVEAFRTMPPPTGDGQFLTDIQSRLRHVNVQLQNYAASHFPGAVMGSTVAALAGYQDKAMCVWAGDSRVYRSRNGRLQQLTRDHSQVETLIAMGVIRRENAASHPESHVITRAVGAATDLDIDVYVDEMHLGDSYLICSDGLTNAVSEADIGEMMCKGGCEETVGALLHLALVRGARDNVTLIVVEVEAGAQP